MSISSRNKEDLPAEGRTPPSQKILIGRVLSAHGLEGELSIAPLTDYPERFEKMTSIDLYRNEVYMKTVEVNGVRSGAKGSLILATTLSDRSEAEACAGAEILIDPEDRVPLPEGQFWIDDLLGLNVEDIEGNPLGVVSDFVSSGASDLYEVRDPEGKTHYIPAVDAFIREVDLSRKKLRVQLIEGLWDSCTLQ